MKQFEEEPVEYLNKWQNAASKQQTKKSANVWKEAGLRDSFCHLKFWGRFWCLMAIFKFYSCFSDISFKGIVHWIAVLKKPVEDLKKW